MLHLQKILKPSLHCLIHSSMGLCKLLSLSQIIIETYCNDSLEFVMSSAYNILKFQLSRQPHESSQKKNPMKSMVPSINPGIHEYNHSMIQWYNKKLSILDCLDLQKLKFGWERERTGWMQWHWWLEKKLFATNDYFLEVGNMLWVYICKVLRTKHRFVSNVRAWLHHV